MSFIVWQSFLAALVGGLLSLDRTAAFQVMVSRPIVAAPVVGYVLGDAVTGLLIGGVLELLFIGGLPVGGHIPPHEIMMTTLITAISLIAQKALSGSGLGIPGIYKANTLFVIGFVILTALPADAVCKKADVAARIFNMRFFNAALADMDKGIVRYIVINNLKGACVFFVFNFLTVFVLTFAGVLFVYLFLPAVPSVIIMSLPLACGAAVVLGLSSAYSALYGNRSQAVFLAATFFSIAVIAAVIR